MSITRCSPWAASNFTHWGRGDPELIKDAQSSDNPVKMLLTFHKMKKYASIITDEMYKACEDSELVVYHPGCLMHCV